MDPVIDTAPAPPHSTGSPPIRHLYFHIPWCHRICPYCAFYKHLPGRAGTAEFVAALLAAARAARNSFGDAIAPETIYFGGGTPTFLPTAQLEELLAGLHGIFDLRGVREWTFEVNPRTISPRKAQSLRAHGVTRASLGVQAWDPPTLATLGRDHSPDDARRAFAVLRAAGFPAIGIDLMFSVPGQSLDQWRESLRETIRLQPDHISAYNLTWEEDTEFFQRLQAGEFREDDDRDADCFEAAINLLEAAGYRQYEISNYARPGFESAHNRACWAGADYLGFGPSAVSTVRGRRWTALPDTAAWTRATLDSRDTRTALEEIDARKWLCERIALSLRTADGIPAALLHRASHVVGQLTRDGFLAPAPNHAVALTRAGRFHADTIAATLWDAADDPRNPPTPSPPP